MHDPKGFARVYLLPVLWIFAIPAFALWFGAHVEASWNQEIGRAALDGLAQEASVPAEERAAAEAFWGQVDVGALCASQDPELAELRAQMTDLCWDVSQIGWMQRLGIGSLVLGVLTLLIGGACAGAAFVSRPLQIAGFVVGWNFLRVASAVQTIVQGVLATALSYWVTAFWFEIYVPKLILVVGIVAALSVFALLKAIFTRTDLVLPIEGRELTPEAAPELWARVRGIAEQVGTTPPDRIVAGIDDNFFVTEGDVTVGGERKHGRTLFVSLSLLRVLSRGEADAVLAHEMAHFSGGDTAYSRKLAPRLARFGRYLDALAQTAARPVFHTMNAFWALFHLAAAGTSRDRELRADAVSVEVTSAQDAAGALMRISGYASYRERVERSLFDQDQRLSEVAIADRVRGGFATYARSPDADEDFRSAHVPHPFDSHPPLDVRLAAIGMAEAAGRREDVLLAPTVDSWCDAIPDAATIEGQLWADYERRFADAHEVALAYRYEPATEAEAEIVVRHFPPLEFPFKNGEATITLDHRGLVGTEWDEPLPFDHVGSAAVAERMLRQHLDLTLATSSGRKGIVSVPLGKLRDGKDAFLAAFERYWNRHLTMRALQAQAAAAAPDTLAS